jgi:hypothetical protein
MLLLKTWDCLLGQTVAANFLGYGGVAGAAPRMGTAPHQSALMPTPPPTLMPPRPPGALPPVMILLDMQNRTFGPYFAAAHGILIPMYGAGAEHRTGDDSPGRAE